MIEGIAYIYNFNEDRGKEDMLKEASERIDQLSKSGLIVDEIIIKFTEKTTYQSNPDEGNLPKKLS